MTDSIQEPPSAAQGQLQPQETAIDALVHAAHRVDSPAGFYREATSIIAQHLEAVYATLEVRSGATPIRQAWSLPEVERSFWSGKADSFITDTIVEGRLEARIFGGRESDLQVAFLCSPIGSLHRDNGAMIVAMPFRDGAKVDQALNRLDLLCALANSLVDGVQQMGIDPSTSMEAASPETVGHIQKVAEFTSELELAFAITNRLRTRDSSEQVILSTVNGPKVRVLAISGEDSISERSPGLKLIRGAAEECSDLARTVVCQKESFEHGEETTRGGRLHHCWRESYGGGCVASIPMFLKEKVVAVLSIRRNSGNPFDAEDLEELRSLLAPYAAGLEMVRFARRSLIKHTHSAIGTGVHSFLRAGYWGRKALLLSFAVLVGWAFYAQIDYSVRAPGQIQPVASRKLAAASDGVLIEVLVRPGDQVKLGDVLCRFDTSTARLEQSRLLSEIAILDVERYRALNGGSPTEVKLAQAQGRAVQANLALIEHRLEHSTIRATVDGIILTGDLRSRLGDAFPKGEPLFEIAEPKGWKLDLKVAESDVSAISVGMLGQFSSHSKPEQSHSFEISSIAPAAFSHDGMNTFRLEASCDLHPDWARSGMAGFASIDAGTRTPAWVAFHRVLDFARLHLWL